MGVCMQHTDRHAQTQNACVSSQTKSSLQILAVYGLLHSCYTFSKSIANIYSEIEHRRCQFCRFPSITDVFFSHYPTAAVEGAVKEGAADTKWGFVAVSISRDISVCCRLLISPHTHLVLLSSASIWFVSHQWKVQRHLSHLVSDCHHHLLSSSVCIAPI